MYVVALGLIIFLKIKTKPGKLGSLKIIVIFVTGLFVRQSSSGLI